MKRTSCSQRIYRNAGNLPLLDAIPPQTRVLDCGCGAGDNARILAAKGCRVTGITISPAERDIAAAYFDQVYVADLNLGFSKEIKGEYEVVLLSHLLEHLFYPEILLRDVKRVLAPDGLLAVALPNVLTYRNRLDFLRGRFEYTATGIMDVTHVRFYTFTTGKRLLEENDFRVIAAWAEGAFPLWKLRFFLPDSFDRWLNRRACQYWPGLFGGQSIYLAQAIK